MRNGAHDKSASEICGHLRHLWMTFRGVAGLRVLLRRSTTAALLGICLTSTAADGRGPSGCAWGPVNDVQAVQALLGAWAASTSLPPIGNDAWDISVDGGSTHVLLRFAPGSLTLDWNLDEQCEPVAITIQASADYAGTRPDAAAVKRLVASFRTVTVEQSTGPRPANYAAPWRWALSALGALLIGLLLLAGRRWRAAGTPVGRVTTSDLIRLLGLVGIVALLPYQSTSNFGDWLGANHLVLIGILPLVAFLWLAVSGYFGYGSPRREDWPALIVFLLALGIREGYARHAIEEIEIHFFYGVFPNRHSVVYPLLQMFLQPLARDPYLFMMHVNGVLGALATLPLYMFVRQRTNSRVTAAWVASLFAIHPIIVQMAPTDGHYSLVLFTWFFGLALLTANDIGPRQMVGGATLLGIAATSRAEGSLFLLASLLLIDVGALFAAVRRHLGAAALSCGVVLGLLAIHVYFCFPGHIRPGQQLPNIGTFTLWDVVRAGLQSGDYNDRILVNLVAVGAIAGLLDRRLRIGLGAALGTLVVVWPVSMTTTGGFTILHRLVPVCALQVIAAGVGASWFTMWLPAKLRQHWATALPALAVALYLFAQHHHEVRDPNAVTDEFWMLRNQLAPGGVVNRDCTLLAFGRTMDTDIHNFEQVLPGMTVVRCEQEDCVGIASAGGCFYYLRDLSCYFAEDVTPPECIERGRTPAGDLFACIDPRCAQLERALELSPVEERTVDLYAVFNGLPDRPQSPRIVDIGLYRVIRAKR